MKVQNLVRKFSTRTSIVAVSIMSSLAVAATLTMTEVNTKLQALLAPYNTATTVMKAEFTALNIDSKQTLEFGFAAAVTKVGSYNKAKLDIKKVNYTLGDGTNPTVTAEAQLELDLVKAFGHDMINSVAGDLDKMLVDMAGGYAEDYGPAVSYRVSTSNMVKDPNGNVQSMSVQLHADFDLTKLPADMAVTDAEFKSIDLALSVNLHGVEAAATVVINPQYHGFAKGSDGLKEYIEKLLADDTKTYDLLNTGVQSLDAIAGWLVEMRPN